MTTTIQHARQFMKNDYHFSSVAAETAKNISKRLSTKKGRFDAIFFLQEIIDSEINLTSRGAKAEAIEVLSKLKKENYKENSVSDGLNKTTFLNKMGFTVK